MRLPRHILALLAVFILLPCVSLAQAPAEADPRLEQLASAVSAERLRELVSNSLIRYAQHAVRHELDDTRDRRGPAVDLR